MPRTYNIDIDSYIGYPISLGYVKSKLQPLKGKPCAVRINSYGGDVMTALDIRQQFIDHGNVTAYIVGMTASAATILAMGAKRVVMSRYALMLVHPCSGLVDTFSYYNSEELEGVIASLRKQQADMNTLDGVIASIYAEQSGRPAKEMAALMHEARWITADEALQYGLIDAIDEDEGEAEPTVKMTNAEREHFVACGLPLPEANESAISANAKREKVAAPCDNSPETVNAKRDNSTQDEGENNTNSTLNNAKRNDIDAARVINIANNDKTDAARDANENAITANATRHDEANAKCDTKAEQHSVLAQQISALRNFFKSTGAPDTPDNSTKTVENETPNTPTTMNETQLSPLQLCKVLAIESLSVDAQTDNVSLTTQQVEVVDTYLKEMLDQITQLKAEKDDLEKTINAADGDTTQQAMPTAQAEGEMPGAEAVDFYKRFSGLI